VCRIVRHPLYIGWFIACFATPAMTVGYLLFAAGMSIYIVIAIRYEGRDLLRHFGAEYSEYQRPRFGAAHAPVAPSLPAHTATPAL
jgi:protein-S-isoprenylcysteine O-methyltransferase Ste14